MQIKKKKKKKSSSLFVHLFYGGACQVAQDVSFTLTVCGPPELGLPEHTAMSTKDSSSYNGDYQWQHFESWKKVMLSREKRSSNKRFENCREGFLKFYYEYVPEKDCTYRAR